jgi:photosystem II stability/assembly factor-like uncharacterized protein
VAVPKEFTIIVGTIGDGLWRSVDGGATFGRPKNQQGGPYNTVDTLVKGLAVDPHDPAHVLAGMGFNATPYSPVVGSVHGIIESFDGGETWAPLTGFSHQVEVWRFAFDPKTPGRYFVGTRPAGIYRTDDGGTTFEKLPLEVDVFCRGIGLTRVTSISFHPDDDDVMFCSVEIGGVHRSLDGGDTWERVMTNLTGPIPNGNVFGEDGRNDCHYTRILPGDPGRVLVSTPDGLYASDDLGKTWFDYPIRQTFPAQYHRDIAVKLDDPDTIFVATGDGVAGQEGAVQITRDAGATWTSAVLPDECNSPVWCFAQHASDPDVIVACTHLGMLFSSDDGGRTWVKHRREFTEVRVICWLPARSRVDG